mmetsp:Transcript_14499/g.46557  ORF Transcript_14499/g.46557 Transcript_14499/m.46557 type:complete len:253 (-) Transcript_14499:64-822(-)
MQTLPLPERLAVVARNPKQLKRERVLGRRRRQLLQRGLHRRRGACKVCASERRLAVPGEATDRTDDGGRRRPTRKCPHAYRTAPRRFRDGGGHCTSGATPAAARAASTVAEESRSSNLAASRIASRSKRSSAASSLPWSFASPQQYSHSCFRRSSSRAVSAQRAAMPSSDEVSASAASESSWPSSERGPRSAVRNARVRQKAVAPSRLPRNGLNCIEAGRARRSASLVVQRSSEGGGDARAKASAATNGSVI